MRILGRTIGGRREKGTGEIVTVAAKINTLLFYTIKGGTPLRAKMKVFTILLPASLARYFMFRDSEFFMYQSGQLICQIFYI